MPPLRISLFLVLILCCSEQLCGRNRSFSAFEDLNELNGQTVSEGRTAATQSEKRRSSPIFRLATRNRDESLTNESSPPEESPPVAKGGISQQSPVVARQTDGADGLSRKLPLRKKDIENPQKEEKSSSSVGPILTGVGSLAIVLGLFLVLAWITKRNMPKNSSLLPSEVVEVLGRAPLAARQQMHLVRIGRKLLLVSVTPSGAETLTEITDPAEVDRLSAISQQNRSGSITENFRQVLAQLGKEPAPGGFLGDPGRSDLEIANLETTGSRRNL